MRCTPNAARLGARAAREQREQHAPRNDRPAVDLHRLGRGEAELGQQPHPPETRVERELERHLARAEAVGERRLLGVDRVDRLGGADRVAELDHAGGVIGASITTSPPRTTGVGIVSSSRIVSTA